MDEIQELEQKIAELERTLAAAHTDVDDATAEVEREKLLIEQTQASIAQLEAGIEAKRQLIAEMDEQLAGRSLEIVPILESGNAGRICSLLEQGAGVSFLPDYVTADAVAAGRLVRLSVPDFSIDVWKQLLYHRNKWISPQIRAVMEHLRRFV